jgi:hypothetical protein
MGSMQKVVDGQTWEQAMALSRWRSRIFSGQALK